MTTAAGQQALRKGKEHWEAIRRERFEVDVPEWGENGTPLKCYFTAFNLGEKNALFPYVDNPETKLESLARAVILKLQDENGQRMFSDGDAGDLRELLVRQPPAVIERLGGEIMEKAQGPDDKDLGES